MNNLYHYTSLQGLLGILDKKSLWASDINFLNDSQEFIHGLQFAKKCIQANIPEGFLGKFGEKILSRVGNLKAQDIFVTCFSNMPDLLSQWRGYTPASGGVCLGFSSDAIEAFCASHNFAFEMCTYYASEHDQIMKNLVEIFLEGRLGCRESIYKYRNMTPDQRKQASDEYDDYMSSPENIAWGDNHLEWLCDEILNYAPLFKDNSFYEEHEWRLIAKNPLEVDFRTNANSSYLIPYFKAEILAKGNSEALREIIIGPNPNQNRCQLSVSKLLAKHGLHHVTVRPSSIPYINW
jgi:hypothetical protein